MATIQIGWIDKSLSHDTDIFASDLMHSAVIGKAARHYAVECGGRHARSAQYRLVRMIRRIAERLPDGGVLQLQTSNQTTAPAPWDAFWGLGLELRYVIGHEIQWDISIYSAYEACAIHWCITGTSDHRRSVRIDALLRRIDALARPVFSAQCRDLARRFNREAVGE